MDTKVLVKVMAFIGGLLCAVAVFGEQAAPGNEVVRGHHLCVAVSQRGAGDAGKSAVAVRGRAYVWLSTDDPLLDRLRV